ncbi:MAG: hypothetical protein HOY76_23395 [Streptomyces sp.]|nr:hypothetical protein [Streptomyces sp.]
MTADRRLRRGLALIPGEGTLTLVGALRRHTFRGAFATEILPRLLDGSRRPSELGLREEQVRRVLGLLDERGLLESADAPSTLLDDQQLLYLSRHLAASADYSGIGELLDTLAATAVYVAGLDGFTELVARDLRACGITSLATGSSPPADAFAQRLQQAAHSLAIVLDDSEDPELLVRMTAWCQARGVPVLRVGRQGGHLEMGPCFLGRATACVDCLRRGRSEAGWDTADPDAEDPNADVLAGLAGSEALTLLARVPAARSLQLVSRITLDGWTTQERLVMPYHDCLTCGHGTVPVSQATWAAETYEWSVRRPPHGRVLRPGPPGANAMTIERAKSQRPALSSHPRAPVDHPVLSEILRRVVGFRDDLSEGERRRWAPTGGNLASVELYMITSARVPGLPGTAFRYDDLRHELIALCPDPISLSQALAGTDVDAKPLDAALVFVAAKARIAAKYGLFSYRLACLDAGCATTQLVSVAQEERRRVEFASRWGARLDQLLDLAPGAQFVTAVAGICFDTGRP